MKLFKTDYIELIINNDDDNNNTLYSYILVAWVLLLSIV